jgi:acyl carrier protein
LIERERLDSLLRQVLRLPAEEITDELTMDDVGRWDSLTHMELIAAIEDEFGIELSGDDIVEMTNAGAIRRVVDARTAHP